MTLGELFTKYACDKGPAFHAYERIYEPLLHHLHLDEGKLLEIGVRWGDSLQAWADYFKRFKIVGMDINTEYKYPPRDNITVLQGDQGSIHDLEHVTKHGPYDVIVDDGSHQESHITISFNYLFVYALKPGGIYIVEDMHSQYLPEFAPHREFTAFDLFYNLVDELNWHGKSQCGDPGKKAHHVLTWWETAIKSIEFHKSVIVIRKQ